LEFNVPFQHKHGYIRDDGVLSNRGYRCFSKHNRTQAIFVPVDTDRSFDLDLETCLSEGPNTTFVVNVAQIRSTVPEIFHTQKDHRLTAPKTTPIAVHCVR